MDTPRPDGWQGSATAPKIISGQRGFRPPHRGHDDDLCEGDPEMTFDEFDYRNLGNQG